MRIFYDVDTEKDFMNKDWALYVQGAEEIKPNCKKITKHAREKKEKRSGSIDKHFGTPEYKNREGELARWGGPFSDHTMNETEGCEKIDETKTGDELYHAHYLDNRIYKNLLIDAIKTNKPLFFEKQSYDVFTNPAFEEFLSMAEVTEAIVYGVATDYCVKAAVLGMQKRGIQCYVVEDAIKGVDPETTKSALEEMVEAGARFVKTKDVIGGKI